MSTIKSVEQNLILDVRSVFRDGGDWCVVCPHCKAVIGIEGDTLEDIRGEQFQHSRREIHGTGRYIGCGGWLEVAHDARRTQPPQHLDQEKQR